MRRIYLLLVSAFCCTVGFSQTIWRSNFSNPDDWFIKEYVTSEAKWVIGETNTSLWMDAIKSSSGGNYALFNSNMEVNEEQDAAIIINPYLPVKYGKELHIRFQHNFKQWGDEILYFLFYTYNGDSVHWEVLNSDFNWNDSTSNPQIVDLDLTKYIAKDDSVYFGFEYYSSTGNNYAWYIDDVVLYYPSTDAEVTNISTLGKLPIHYATPHKIKAKVSNIGSNAMSNINVTLNISGSNSFTNKKIISNLVPDSSTIITFDDFIPTNVGNEQVKVSLTTDDFIDNNSKTITQEVTYNVYSYADTSKATTSFGIKGADGMSVVKFHINELKNVKNINVVLYDTRSIGKTVYGILLDKNGKEISRSDNYIIQSTDLDKWHTFLLKSFPPLENTDFYVGLAQKEAGDAYWPVGAQPDFSTNIEGYYWAIDLLPTELVHDTSTSYRLLIDAVLGDPDPTICLITNDMKTDKNVIIWERIKSGTIAKYKIYREGSIAKKYELIGESPYDSTSAFLDKTGLNKRRQYSYKISYVDTMGNESEQSPFHKTLLLQFGGGLDAGKVNINWQQYEVEDKPIQFESYYIYRSVRDDSINLLKIDSIPGDQTAYNDFYLNALKYRTHYRIAGLLKDACNPFLLKQLGPPYIKAGSGGYVESISNMEDNRLRQTWDGVDYESLYRFALYPNPISKLTSVYYNLPYKTNIDVVIMDVLGKNVSILFSGIQNTGDHQVSLNTAEINNLPKGLYILQFKNDRSVITRQFIKVQ